MSSPGADLVFVRPVGNDSAPLTDDTVLGMWMLISAVFLLSGAYWNFYAPVALQYRHWRARAGIAELRAACTNAV